ncbi:MAG: single-stranded DNA-binding protein [Methanobrevibacter sp.]|nr:single-stranded DNA-binding protein [Methanobrevibacter sp.]
MRKPLNRVDLLGEIAYPQIGTSSQGNDYARFSLKYSKGMKDGKELFVLIPCMMFGETLQQQRHLIVENSQVVIRGNLNVQNKQDDYGEWKRDFFINVTRIVDPKNVKELNEAPAQGVPVSQQQAYTTSEPVEHRVSIAPRRQSKNTVTQPAEIDDDEMPF